LLQRIKAEPAEAPDKWSNLSGDVLNISALVNGAMSSKNFFVEGRNKRSALRRPSSARFEAAYGEKRFFWHARNQRSASGV